jgi:hypothetical protein
MHFGAAPANGISRTPHSGRAFDLQLSSCIAIFTIGRIALAIRTNMEH